MIIDSKITSEFSYPLRYYEMDSQMVLKTVAVLNFLQDIATVNAEVNGFGYTFLTEHNYGWFLIKYHMEFEDYPEKLDDVIIKTEARGASKLYALREFEIWTSDKKKCLARVISDWFLLNLENKEILSPLKVFDKMSAVEKREDDLKFEKFKAPDTFDAEKDFEIRFDDIDINQHVNNSIYIAWAFEILPQEHRLAYKLKTLDMVYKKEVKFGYNVVSKMKYDKETNTTYHVLVNKETQEDLCLVKAQWTPIAK